MNPFKQGDYVHVYAAPALSHTAQRALVHMVDKDAVFLEIYPEDESFQGCRMFKVNYRQCRKMGRKKNV